MGTREGGSLGEWEVMPDGYMKGTGRPVGRGRIPVYDTEDLFESLSQIVSDLHDCIASKDAEIKHLEEINANNVEGWRQDVAGRARHIEELRARIRELEGYNGRDG